MSIASELQDLNDNILDAYDAINTKGGTVPANKNTANLATAISSISGGGGGSGNWADVMSGGSTELSDSSITKLRQYALGVVGNISDRGYLTKANLPSVVKIESYAFYYQTKLTTATFSDNLTYIGNYAFSDCTRLTAVSCKNVENVYSYAFYYCSALQEIVMPKSNSIPQSVCGFCSSLVKADFGSLNNSTIGSGAFSSCSSLATLIIRKTGTALKGRSGMIPSNCPIGQGTGYIYVPSALVNTYKSANYWSTYANQIRAIEDYSDDGTVNGDINV